MTTIALKATIVAGTGTGKTFGAYNMTGPLATYREEAPIAAAGAVTLKRTEPKATKDYAGAARGEVKLTRYFPDTLGRLWPAVFTVSSSIPAFLTDAQKMALVVEGTLLAQEQPSQDVLSKLIVPQS